MNSHRSLLNVLLAAGIFQQPDPRIAYLESRGWICLGKEALTGEVHWTTLARGAGEGGPVPLDEAARIQREEDATSASR